MSAESTTKAAELLEELEEIKTFPDIATRIVELTSKDDATIREIEELVRMDPVLCSRILRMVNSAYYSLRVPVKNLSKAVIFIGMRNLRNLVVIDSLKDFFLSKNDGSAFSRRRLWLRCVAAGVCAQLVSRRLYGRPGEDAFLAGLLHELGLMVEDQTRSEPFQEAFRRYSEGEAPLLTLERKFLGTDHCEVGALVAEAWNFPEEIQELIAEHHQPVTHPDVIESLRGVVQLSCYVAGMAGYPLVADQEEPMPGGVLDDHIRRNASDYEVLAEDLQEEMKKAAALYDG